jgi:CCR4-NOT transcription complex subunit 1
MLNFYMQDMEEKFPDIVQEASKENLELGCKMIKKAVIEKAKVWVKQDPEIIEAIEKRKKFIETGEKYF